MKKRKNIAAIAMSLSIGAMLLGTSLPVQAAGVADALDTQAYADEYADLKAAFGYDANLLLKHYIQYGIAEERNAEGLVDVVKYRAAYADLDAAFGDNWDAYVDHYLTYGVKEGRENFTKFDATVYQNNYADLKGLDTLGLWKHYLGIGKAEGRIATSAEGKTNTTSVVAGKPNSTGSGSTAGNTNSSNGSNNSGTNTTENNLHPYVTEVIRLVNEERAKAGVAAVVFDAKVQAAAEVRVKELEQSPTHTRPDGSSCFTALEDQGIAYVSAGENIAGGYKTPQEVMEGWMNSTGHRENILRAKYTRIGVGYYQDASGTTYWTQMFLK